MRRRHWMFAWFVAACVVHGCGSSAEYPRITRPFTANERAEVMRICAVIAEVGPRWQPYADEVLSLLAIGRVGIGTTRGEVAWAQWGQLTGNRIILSPAWFALGDTDKGIILVQEGCHLLTHKRDECHEESTWWEAEYFAATREGEARATVADHRSNELLTAD